MSYALVAQGAATAVKAAARYAPVVINQSKELLNKVTSGRVRSLNDVPTYVGNSADRLRVVTRAMVTSGMKPEDILPTDLIGQAPILAQIRQELIGLLTTQRDQYDAGSPKGGDDDVERMTAKNALMRGAVEAVRRVYGSADTYFLCHPTGGVPRSWFAWYDSTFKGQAIR